MKNLRKYFAVLSVILLVVLAISPLKDFLRQWRFVQYRYNALAAAMPVKVEPVAIGIRQIWNSKLDRVDRCVTCHLGATNPAFANAPQPYRQHPHIYHDIEEFGCTICHEGQGSATSFEESIGKVEYWDKPIIPREYMEASCAKCHKEQNVPEAPLVNLGRKIIREANCVGCHKLDGYEKQWVPHLDGLALKVNRQWLVAWLKNPKAYFPKTRMPNFLMGDDEVDNLADFLLSSAKYPNQVELDPLPAVLTTATEEQKTKLADLGSTRFKEARCISCHPINGKGGYVATDLGKVASKVSEQWLYNYIKNPRKYSPDVRMPRFRFSDQDLVAVVAYMEGEFVDYDLEKPPGHTPDPDYYEKGLATFKKYNCSGCHQLGTMSKPEEMAPELTAIGSKKLYEIEFGKSGIEQTLPAYLDAKLKTPRVFASNLKMPSFGFSDEEARAVTVALLGNTNERLPESYIVHAAPPSTYAPQGEFGKIVNDLACFGCHVMQGQGRLVATDLSIEGSQARRSWIEGYFKIPYSLRPILTERMPNFYLAPDEIKTISDYFEQVFVADTLERTVPTDPATVAKGKGLYFEKYGCQACHQIAGKGGYVGPPLDKLNSRLKPGWVFHWLKKPQAYRPESIEPDNNLPDDEAEALTAYLMTLP